MCADVFQRYLNRRTADLRGQIPAVRRMERSDADELADRMETTAQIVEDIAAVYNCYKHAGRLAQESNDHGDQTNQMA